ncbi:MAG: flippase-like domain-containing protein [Prevotellaceae bacterium]|jgi:uncharacterized protein (TIRG00374 family)|nr:flippase-like domain-containing protein [Prevotellaceae bacterium]
MTKKKQIFQFSLFLLLTAALVWLSFRNADLGRLVDGLRNADYSWVIVCVLVGIAAYFIRARRWALLLEPMGYTPSLWQMYNAVMVGYIANLAFPRLGEVMRCGALAKSNKIPLDKLVGTVVAERAFDTVCLLAIIATTFFLRIDTFGKFVREKVLGQLSGVNVSLLLAALAIALLVAVLLVWRFRVALQKYGVVRKIFGFARGIWEGLKSFTAMRRRAEFVLHTVLLWICYWLMSWLVLFALPETAGFNAVDGLVVMLLGSFGMVAPTNGGIGAFHFITSLGLTYIFGVSTDSGLAYATLSHESQLIFVLILGAVSAVSVFIAPSGAKRNVG